MLGSYDRPSSRRGSGLARRRFDGKQKMSRSQMTQIGDDLIRSSELGRDLWLLACVEPIRNVMEEAQRSNTVEGGPGVSVTVCESQMYICLTIRETIRCKDYLSLLRLALRCNSKHGRDGISRHGTTRRVYCVMAQIAVHR
jgi:hypothetical protein